MMKFDTRLIAMYGIPKKHKFNITKGDILIFHHIQKTAGTSFGRHLMSNLDTPGYPCDCSTSIPQPMKCHCPNKVGSKWIFSRFTGWACGIIHAT